MQSQIKSNKGQAMVEFAIAMPFLFLIIISVLYFGRYFLIAQIVLHAAQEGAKLAANTPNLSDDTTRSNVRGFTSAGSSFNVNSPIYSALSAAGLLSNGLNNNSSPGNLPQGGSVLILPWDQATGTTTTYVPPAGTLAVVINYPFQFLGNPFTGLSTGVVSNVAVSMGFGGTALKFGNFTITEQAVTAQQVYQQ